MMATYKQILDEVTRKPGDTWKTASGNWYGMKQGEKGEKNPTQSYGPEGQKKAKVYATGGDPDKEDDSKKDKEEPKKTSGKERKRPESVEGINDFQSDLENKRDMGIAGAGGQKASQGESRYCNALNSLDNDKFREENKESIDTVASSISSGNIKLKKDDIKDLQALGLDPNSEEGMQYIATREIYAESELERIKGIDDSVFYQKAGFDGDEEGYREWMRAGYDGALATRKILREDTDLDVSKPMTTMQSTGEIDDKVASDLQKKVDSATTEEDKKYYQNEYDEFQHFREYHDTYTVGVDTKGRTHVVSISNKKGSELKDPQNNTTPANRFNLIEKKQGKAVAKKVTTALEEGIEQVSDTKLSAIKRGNDTPIDDSIAAICDTPEMKKYVGKLDKRKDFQQFVKDQGKDISKISTKEKLQLMQEQSKKIISEGDKPAYEPYGKIWTKMGELNKTKKFQSAHPNIDFKSKSVQESIEIKQAEKDAVTSAHQRVVDEITKADGGPKKPGEDNGPHTQGYVDTVMDAMHFNSYIDGGDKKMIIQMGIRGGQPSQIRGCLAEQSGFKGDVNEKEGKEALKDHLRKRCRIDQANGNILIKDEGGERVIAEDTWRTAGTSQKVASGFGDSMRDCIMSKIDSKAAKGERGKVSPKYESLEGTISRIKR